MKIKGVLKNKRGIQIIAAVLLLSLINVNQAAQQKVKVKAEMADIYLKPDMKSQIISRVPSGTILDLKSKEGKWYKVNLPPDEKGRVKSGYIHQRVVEDVKEKEKEKRLKTIIAAEEEKYKGERVTLKFKDADIRDVIIYLCNIGGLNVVFDPEVSGKVTCDLKDVPWDQALDIILKTHKLGRVIEGNVLRTGKIDKLIKEKRDKRK